MHLCHWHWQVGIHVIGRWAGWGIPVFPSSTMVYEKDVPEGVSIRARTDSPCFVHFVEQQARAELAPAQVRAQCLTPRLLLPRAAPSGPLARGASLNNSVHPAQSLGL